MVPQHQLVPIPTLAPFPGDFGSPGHPQRVFNPSPTHSDSLDHYGGVGFGDPSGWTEEGRCVDSGRGPEIDNTSICDHILNSIVPSGEIDPEHTWACPFFKLDPINYAECLGRYSFRRIHDVKQHILRRHTVAEYHCPNCWEEFSHHTPWKEHTQNITCHPTPGPENLSQQECEALKNTRFPAGLSDKQKWYLIWQQLFAMHPPPSSPYVGNGFCEPNRIIRPYAISLLKERLPEVLKQHGVNLDSNSTYSLINEISTLSHPIPAEIIPARRRQSPQDRQIFVDSNPVGEPIQSFCGPDLLVSVYSSPTDQFLYATTNSEPPGGQSSMLLQGGDAPSQLSPENSFPTPQSSQGQDWSSHTLEPSSSMDAQSERFNRNSVDGPMIDTSLESTFTQFW